MLEDPKFDGPPYIGPLVNMSLISQIQRGNDSLEFGWLGWKLYKPPSLELYTLFSRNMYLLIFWILHSIQIFLILLAKLIFFKSTNCNTVWKNFICSIEQSHYPFPSEDWDAKKGGCVDHIKRQRSVQKEFLVMTFINLAFNMVLLFPLLILCKLL